MECIHNPEKTDLYSTQINVRSIFDHSSKVNPQKYNHMAVCIRLEESAEPILIALSAWLGHCEVFHLPVLLSPICKSTFPPWSLLILSLSGSNGFMKDFAVSARNSLRGNVYNGEEACYEN